jgi:AraC family transcriptional regulator
MSIASPLAIDFAQESAPALILPNLPLLTSDRSNWHGVHLAYHQQPPWELPELAGAQHVIYIPFAQQLATVEALFAGQFQTVMFDVDEFANACSGILPANLPYKLCWNINVEFLHLYVEPIFLAQIAHETIDPDRIELMLEPKLFDRLMYHLGLALKAELEQGEMGDRTYADALATALAAHLLRHYTTHKHTLPEYEDGLPKLKLKQAIEYINEHLGENLSLTAIAEQLEMSQYHFGRLFKQSMGQPPHQYLIQQRVERAKQLLKQPELSITAIAIACGFTHQSHLAKHFRQQTKLSPTQFRRL